MPQPSLLLVLPAAALILAACSHHPAKVKASAQHRSISADQIEEHAGIASPDELGYEVDDARQPGVGYPSYPIRSRQNTHRRSPPHPVADESESYGEPPVNDAAFPRFPGLEPAVAFWRNTYAVWSRSQAAIHDDRYMAVVYEIVDLPGEVGDSLSSEQKGWIAERREYWRNRLALLEGRLASGEGLDDDDRQLSHILEKGGNLQTVLPGAAERVRSQRGMRERFMRGLEIGTRYEQTFRKIFRQAGLPEDLAYLPHVESSFQAAARSSAGAVGVWQFTRAGAQNYLSVNSRVDERLDPIASTYGAARYLSDAYAKLGNWPTALTSYNHGVNGMVRAQNQMGSDFMRIVKHYNSPAFGFAGRNYYAEFLAARDIAREPRRYFSETVGYND